MKILLTIAVLSCLAAAEAKAQRIQFEGEGVNRYTKVWTDDYYNYHKDVYHAYVKQLKNDDGPEIPVEIWHGPMTGYHENGVKSVEGVYRHGRREGKFKYWAENGVLTGEADTLNGHMHGKYIQWSANKAKIREETYRHGKLEGEALWWDKEGRLLTSGTYRAGQPWSGSFPELKFGSPSSWMLCNYQEGKKTSEEPLTAGWWW